MRLGVFSATAFLVGSMVGSGIFIAPSIIVATSQRLVFCSGSGCLAARVSSAMARAGFFLHSARRASPAREDAGRDTRRAASMVVRSRTPKAARRDPSPRDVRFARVRRAPRARRVRSSSKPAPRSALRPALGAPPGFCALPRRRSVLSRLHPRRHAARSIMGTRHRPDRSARRRVVRPPRPTRAHRALSNDDRLKPLDARLGPSPDGSPLPPSRGR